MSDIISKRLLKLGKNIKKDRGVLLGYKSKRAIKKEHLSIGDGALIRSGAVIYAGSSIGSNLETGHNVVIREQNLIGNNLSIWNNSVIDYGCKIGNSVKIHSNVYVAQFSVIEDNCFLAPGVIIANDLHPGPTLKKGAQIGVNVTILPGVVIGENSLIGAGSVVTKDVPDGMVAFGNPARVRRSVYNLRCPFKITEQPYKKDR